MCPTLTHFFSFFFTDPAPPEFYTLSLHDALPIWLCCMCVRGCTGVIARWWTSIRGTRKAQRRSTGGIRADRKSTRLNSSHLGISYAVFCLKKKKRITKTRKQKKYK